MTYRPKEIARKVFMTTLRGYDRVEVRTFLRAVAEDYAEALNALARPGLSPGAAATAPARSLRRAFPPGSLDLSLVLRPDAGITFIIKAEAESTVVDELTSLRTERAELLRRIDELESLTAVGANPDATQRTDTHRQPPGARRAPPAKRCPPAVGP